MTSVWLGLLGSGVIGALVAWSGGSDLRQAFGALALLVGFFAAMYFAGLVFSGALMAVLATLEV